MSTLNTLEKCVKILTLFSEISPVMNVPDIAERLGLPTSTTYRYISTLKQCGLIEEADKSGTYCLGSKILDLAHSVPKRSLQGVSLPIMNRLSRRTGETVILSGLRQQYGVCLEKVEGHHALRVTHERGATFPLHAGASGKILIAYLAPEERDRIIEQMDFPRFSETTITDPRRLRSELKTIKEQGFALSDGESIRGTYGIATPILTRSGKIVAALSISAPSHRLEVKKRERIIQLMVAAAGRITGQLYEQNLK